MRPSRSTGPRPGRKFVPCFGRGPGARPSYPPYPQSGASGWAVAAKEQQKEQQDVASTTSHEPDVLIQPEEEELLKRFYAGMRNPVGEAKVVVTDNHEVTPKSLVIEQIEVRDLRIENLDEESGLAQTGTK